MQLGFGIAFPDLYEREGLIRLDRAFIAFLREADRALADKLVSARAQPPAAAAESELLIALAATVLVLMAGRLSDLIDRKPDCHTG